MTHVAVPQIANPKHRANWLVEGWTPHGVVRGALRSYATGAYFEVPANPACLAGIPVVYGRKEGAALAISVRKRETFLSCTKESPTGLDMRVLARRVRGRFVDGRDWDPAMCEVERLEIGRRVVASGRDGLLFTSPERLAGSCVSLLNGSTLDRAIQGDHFRFMWDGAQINQLYAFRNGEAIRPSDLRQDRDILAA
ncbi:hypothetical protein [Salinarimonas soli]|uniref:RES domain-containing protein n=1 Tax=Salinarimonas soli TaxID=1638099 RepID=A0A5B2V7D3_9HYPH|nr:hypothetical protein [Salinarimonas soli]KAA2234904.1 hypothetical protein F0L46_21395 [Salinarimonas soli]